MRERTTADTQLERILYILPAAARPDGAPLSELAAVLGITEAEVMGDIHEVTARAFYQPGGTVDSFDISMDGDRVRVRSTIGELRPVRLSPRETLALGLGLRMLAAEADAGRRTAVLALARQLESTLAAPEQPPMADYFVAEAPAPREYVSGEADADVAGVAEDDDVAYEIAVGEDEIRALLAEAARERLLCRITYVKPGDAAPTDRTIAPQVLVYAEGLWYVLGRDEAREGHRSFRLDRILRAERTEQPFEVTELDVSIFIRDGRVYAAEDDVPARVRYSPRIARWLLERQPGEARPEPDGSIIVPHRVADPRWLVRHVLQYGPDAEVLDPPELRRAVAAAAGRMADW